MAIRRVNYRLVLLLLLTATITFYLLNLNAWQWYVMVERKVCETPEKEMRELRLLIKDAHKILNRFNLTHVLIYGSLFGAIRVQNVLPWDNDFDIGLYWEEVVLINETDFLEEFRKHNINIFYRSWKGEYVISRNTAKGDLMLFKETWFGERGRTGIEPWLFFVHFRNFHQFPAKLFKKPLPTLQFVGLNMSVPNEGLEIQKHFYPSDWWKESKPKGCE